MLWYVLVFADYITEGSTTEEHDWDSSGEYRQIHHIHHVCKHLAERDLNQRINGVDKNTHLFIYYIDI